MIKIGSLSTCYFGEKDFVTLYFGKNGQVEYVESADIYDTDIYTDNSRSGRLIKEDHYAQNNDAS